MCGQTNSGSESKRYVNYSSCIYLTGAQRGQTELCFNPSLYEETCGHCQCPASCTEAAASLQALKHCL